MKVLILSANTGQGHNSCAQAIREVFEAHGDSCDIVDVLGLVSQKISRVISQSHEKTYRKTPGLSNAGYAFLKHHPSLFTPRKLKSKLMIMCCKQLKQRLSCGRYDSVICTHVIAAWILTAIVQEENLHLHTAFVATDYSCTPGINGTALDQYFIPHETLSRDFVDAGVSAEKLFPTGIPVRKAFVPVADKARRKEQFGIHPDHCHLLIMCGSMGCGPIPALIHTITSSMPDCWEITVVCGTNEQLRNEMQQEYQNHPAVHVRGYEKQMPALLSSADLFLTKPGGLSTSEAAAAAVPMVLVDAVAGCEENNLHHFVKLGMAVTGDTTSEVAELCLELMDEPASLAGMRQRMISNASVNAAERIWNDMQRESEQPPI